MKKRWERWKTEISMTTHKGRAPIRRRMGSELWAYSEVRNAMTKRFRHDRMRLFPNFWSWCRRWLLQEVKRISSSSEACSSFNTDHFPEANFTRNCDVSLERTDEVRKECDRHRFVRFPLLETCLPSEWHHCLFMTEGISQSGLSYFILIRSHLPTNPPTSPSRRDLC